MHESSPYKVRKVILPDNEGIMYTVIGSERLPVDILDRYLRFLVDTQSAPNTIKAYASDLKTFWEFLDASSLKWDDLGVEELARYMTWLKRPHNDIIVLSSAKPARTPSTIQRMVTSVIGFYIHQARRGHGPAEKLVKQTKGFTNSDYMPFLSGIAKGIDRGQILRVPKITKARPKVLSLTQVKAILEAQERLRDKFLFALLFDTGLRLGQALGLRHEDIVSWEQKIQVVKRYNNPNGVYAKSEGVVPTSPDLIRLWNDYMHEEYGDTDSAYVFINIWGGKVGSPLTPANVYEIVKRTQKKVGFDFTPHQFRHTFVTLHRREGVPLDVISKLVLHSSISTTRDIYDHTDVEDMRNILKEHGVFEKIRDIL